ncbi:hypothetical protein RIF29_20626 [Crotalaria pallida]|uniref:Uncharacterized protein n=1 Tax=Crotalaria pallida TaxID=3830 RepID=A0AAN9F5Z0_CROPI
MLVLSLTIEILKRLFMQYHYNCLWWINCLLFFNYIYFYFLRASRNGDALACLLVSLTISKAQPRIS